MYNIAMNIAKTIPKETILIIEAFGVISLFPNNWILPNRKVMIVIKIPKYSKD